MLPPLPMTGLLGAVSNDLSERREADVVEDSRDNVALNAVRRCMVKAVGEGLERLPLTEDVVLLKERRAEEWHFDGGLLSARATTLQNRANEHKSRSLAANDRSARYKREFGLHALKVKQELCDDDVRRAADQSRMREEFVEVTSQTEHVRTECEQRVRDLEREIVVERERRAKIEQQIRDERIAIENIRRDVNDTETRELELMQAKDEQIRLSRSRAQRDTVEIERDADMQVRAIEADRRRLCEELQRQIEERSREAVEAVDDQCKRRQKIEDSLRQAVEHVDQQVRAGIRETAEDMFRFQDNSIVTAQEIKSSDFSHEVRLQENIDFAISALNCAGEEIRQADALQADHGRTLTEAVTTLSDSRKSFAMSSQFNMHFNDKLDKKTRSYMDRSGGSGGCMRTAVAIISGLR
eukprot:TRINITY_DN63515_c0_g1_i1.p1 TRINITY_DN63515_c0_g1~~TRINITY_DN63515_c0_g1_i1.p1  ORF type:complete len:412 (-),score=91.83 TRINITY_DN63515_c0_g1_i1:137-1372(-)